MPPDADDADGHQTLSLSLCLPSRPTSKSDSSMRMRPLQTAAGRSLRRFRITGKAIAVTVGYSDIDVDGLIIDETSDIH